MAHLLFSGVCRWSVLPALLAVLLAGCGGLSASGSPVASTLTTAATPLAESSATPAVELAETERIGSPTAVTPAPLALLPQGEWSERASMGVARSEMPAVLLDGMVYVTGGLGNTYAPDPMRTLEVYDPAADSWTTLAELPEPRHHLAAAGYDGRLYVFGGACFDGCSASDTTFIYDPASDSWSTGAPMPEGRYAGAAVTLADAIYVVGGIGRSNAALRYDPAADSWTTLAELREPREHTAAVAFDGKIYLIAGRYHQEMTSVEVYDPVSDTWSYAPALTTPRGGHGAAVVGGRIYVLGGEVLATQGVLSSVEVFDGSGWQAGASLPLGLHGVPAVGLEDVLLVTGGSERGAAAVNPGRVLAWRP